MTERDIFVAGEEAKYFIDINQEGFSMTDDDFEVELLYGMSGKSLKLTKQDMTADTSGKYFFSVPTAGMVGKVTARFVWQAIDTDIDPDNRRPVDYGLRARLPGGRHHRHRQAAPCHRYQEVPEVRLLHGEVPLRRHQPRVMKEECKDG